MTQYLREVSIQIVGVRPEVRDQQMFPFNELLDKMLPNDSDRNKIRDWLRRLEATPGDTRWAKPTFTGTWHCETILVSLHALSASGTI